MNAQTANITPGPWRYEPGAGHAYNCIRGSEPVHIRGDLDFPGTNSWSDRICENLGGDTPTVRANIALICEAGTVANEIGLTPRQLADQRAELLEALLNVASQIPHWATQLNIKQIDRDCFALVRAAIAKAGGAA